jgi:hypothetical protein
VLTLKSGLTDGDATVTNDGLLAYVNGQLATTIYQVTQNPADITLTQNVPSEDTDSQAYMRKSISSDDAQKITEYPIFEGEDTTGKSVTVLVQNKATDEVSKTLNANVSTSAKVEKSEIRDVVYGYYEETEDGTKFRDQSDSFEGGYIYFDLIDGEKNVDQYVIAHLIMHSTDPNKKAGTIEYLKPTLSEDGTQLRVYATSLSPFVVIKADAALPDSVYTPVKTISGAGNDGNKTDTDKSGSGSGASVKPDNTGTIILIGAVAATAVVGGVIAYNWDKLPVHKIEGTVVDANGAAVANATVEIAKDGKVVKTVTTDANGYYSAKVAKGEYTITATVGEASTTAEGSTGTAAQLAIA